MNSLDISLKSLIKFNEDLICFNSFDEITNHLSFTLKDLFSIEKFSIAIKNKIIFTNLDEEKANNIISLKINKYDDLIINYISEKNYDNDLNKIFNILSQTLYAKFLEQKLEETIIKDTLTGLYNRNYVYEYLRTILPLVNREGKKLAFLKIGIDHFKAVVDEFDYEIGDEVIKELSYILKNSIRESDLIARFDSDEFLVILHNINNENNAIMIAKKLINNFKEAKVIINEETKQSLMKTICTGILICPDDAEGINDILRSTDIALYEAKNLGRGQFYKFTKNDNSIELF
jgi:diguanylate cyclase (GGDEF)-like protein